MSAHVDARVPALTRECMRDEEVRQSVTHSRTLLARGACVMRHPRHFSPPFYSRPSAATLPPLPAIAPWRTEKIPPTTLIQTRRRPSSTIRTKSTEYPIHPAARLSPGKSSCKYARNCQFYLCKHPPLPRERARLWKLDLRIRYREFPYAGGDVMAAPAL